jgi:restriction system protein
VSPSLLLALVAAALLLPPFVYGFVLTLRGLRHAAELRGLDLSGIDRMSGAEFERYVARLLRHEGYRGVRITGRGGDNGVDIVARKGRVRYSIQCKRYKDKVSRTAISDAVAGMKPYRCTAAMVVTNSRFTENAQEFARDTDCVLVDRDVLAEWIARYRQRGA